MKVRPLPRFSRDDYRAADAWFYDFLDGLNVVVDALNPVFANGLDIDNNLISERRTLAITHGVPINVRLNVLKSRPTLVRVGYAAGYVGHGAITKYNSDGTIAVTVYFLGTPPAGAVNTTIVLEP
jgi:hypothetical protein